MPAITINAHPLEVVDKFTYLGSTISGTLNLDAEVIIRIAKAASFMPQLNERVWRNNHRAVNTKLSVYHACVLSFLLYGSEAWTTYASQEKRLNSFHLRCLRRILHIRWQDRVTNTTVLHREGIPSMFALLSFHRVRWLGHL